MKTPIRPLAMAIALIHSPFALAADAGAERELETVTISASRSETNVEEMPLHTTVIARDEIERSPAQTLDQLLRGVPGMNFSGVPASQSDPTGHQTKMRGLGNAKVLVLLDGVPIHDPFYMTTQWFKLPLSNIERVEVVRGGNSSLWGNMAVAGVVNVVTRRARDNAGEVTMSIGSRGTANLALSKNFAVSEALSFHLAADLYHTDGYQTTPSEYLWRFPGKGAVRADNRNLQLTTYFKPASDLSGFVRVGYHVQDQDISYENGSNVQRSPDFAANLTKALGAGSSLTANAWAQYVRFEKYNGSTCYYQGGTSCVNSNSASLTPAAVNDHVVEFYTQYGHQRYREQGASLIYSQRLAGRWTGFEAGIDYRALKAEDTERFYTTPTSPAVPQGNFNSSTFGEGRQTFAGLFGQTRVFPIDPLEVTLSARFDTWRISDRANTRSTAAGVTTGGELPASDKSAFNPSLALRYELTDAASLRAAAYKAFRAPGFNNLTRTFGTGTSTTIANPDLAPETLTGWELGGDYRKGPLSLSATYFMYDIKDMIATYTAKAGSAPAQVQLICGGPALPGCGGSAKYYTNDQDGRAHGVELTGNWRIRHDLSLDAWYTRTETYLTRHGNIVTDPVGVQLVAVPKDLASIGVNWRPLEKLRTFAEVRYIGAMLLDTTSTNGTTRFGQGSNTVVNASATWAWSPAVDVFGSVVNLFDRAYSENAYAYNQPYNRSLSQPRALSAGLRMRF
ncbi:TonB-dependent receptor [Zoogloea sp.]|uniref:TonB-dependent receptor n=1 Tax=Zoogloea sp. TaxID=49181 RepID=UPI0035B16DA5